MNLKLNPQVAKCVVTGFEAFVEKIDLDKYTNLLPSRGRVVVKKFDDQPGENTQGSIIITGTEKDKQEIGVVVSVGGAIITNNGDYPIDFAPGDVVLFPAHFGHDFVFGQDREVLMSVMCTDLIAKLK